MTGVLKTLVIAKGACALHSRVASLALRAIHLLAICLFSFFIFPIDKPEIPAIMNYAFEMRV